MKRRERKEAIRDIKYPEGQKKKRKEKVDLPPDETTLKNRVGNSEKQAKKPSRFRVKRIGRLIIILIWLCTDAWGRGGK